MATWKLWGVGVSAIRALILAKYPHPEGLDPLWRQRAVNLILFLWRVMPLRLRIWAFMNDGDLIGDVKFNSPDKV